jgi:hypothetical protein
MASSSSEIRRSDPLPLFSSTLLIYSKSCLNRYSTYICLQTVNPFVLLQFQRRMSLFFKIFLAHNFFAETHTHPPTHVHTHTTTHTPTHTHTHIDIFQKNNEMHFRLHEQTHVIVLIVLIHSKKIILKNSFQKK